MDKNDFKVLSGSDLEKESILQTPKQFAQDKQRYLENKFIRENLADVVLPKIQAMEMAITSLFSGNVSITILLSTMRRLFIERMGVAEVDFDAMFKDEYLKWEQVTKIMATEEPSAVKLDKLNQAGLMDTMHFNPHGFILSQNDLLPQEKFDLCQKYSLIPPDVTFDNFKKIHGM